MWIDTHAHLFDLSAEAIGTLVSEALAASVTTIVSTSTNLSNAKDVVSQCSQFDHIFGAVGISPFDIIDQPDNWLEILQNFLSLPKIIAVGEIGIDKTNPRYPSLADQIPFFEKQLMLACSIDKPAIIHSRGAEEMAVDICCKLGVKRALFHCFTGSKAAIERIIDAGYYISFSGIITFKNAEIRSLLPIVPLERLLIETDSPYLAPVPFRGAVNQPSLVKYVGEEICRLLNIDLEKMQICLEHNFKKLFTK